ncbi:hypothetical protein SFUMM280S_09866 [Streptomyces fumanus]
MSVPQLDEEHRGEEILAVFDTAFGALRPPPGRVPREVPQGGGVGFAFYRGTACRGNGLDVVTAAARTGTCAPRACGSTATCTRRTSARTWTPPAA